MNADPESLDVREGIYTLICAHCGGSGRILSGDGTLNTYCQGCRGFGELRPPRLGLVAVLVVRWLVELVGGVR